MEKTKLIKMFESPHGHCFCPQYSVSPCESLILHPDEFFHLS